MRNIKKPMLIVLCALFMLLPGSPAAFEIMQDLRYKNQPDFTPYGFVPVHVAYAKDFWPGRKYKDIPEGSIPDPLNVANIVRKARSKQARYLVLDIEHWPVKQGTPPLIRARSRDLYIATARRFKDTAPDVQIGYYSILPIRDYWRVQRGRDNPKYVNWVADNNQLAPLANEVDALFPSLYTFYANIDGWVRYATANLNQARELAGDKKVFCFLWPRYHVSNRERRKQHLEPHYWRTQLEVCNELADGVVIWDGPAGEWDQTMPWWQETLAFLRDIGHLPEPAE